MNVSSKPQELERGPSEPGTPLKEIVMGLHWTPPDRAMRSTAPQPANLDAMCALLDANEHILEFIRPACPKNGNGSVVHTGDSPEGASEWDDERIFVFLDALPSAAQTLAFVVASVDGHPFRDIAGASCHVSDHRTDEVLTKVDLTALGHETVHCAATLHRTPTGWQLQSGASLLPAACVRELWARALSSN